METNLMHRINTACGGELSSSRLELVRRIAYDLCAFVKDIRELVVKDMGHALGAEAIKRGDVTEWAEGPPTYDTKISISLYALSPTQMRRLLITAYKLGQADGSVRPVLWGGGV